MLGGAQSSRAYPGVTWHSYDYQQEEPWLIYLHGIG